MKIDKVPLPRVVGMILFTMALSMVAVMFDDWPGYSQIPDGSAVIKISFSHGGQPVVECKRLSRAERRKLPPGQRVQSDCPRRRVDLLTELVFNGKTVFSRALPPTGLAGDGPSVVYERFVVAAGPMTITARMRDSRRTQGFDYETTEDVDLQPGQNLVIDFRADEGVFAFQ